MSSRKRRPNWTDQECLLLAQLLHERKDVIRGKYSTGVTLQDKRQAWEEIVQTINAAFPQVQRTVSDCNKKWENLMAKAKEEIKKKRQADEGLSLEQFSTVTQVVILVKNLSNMLQQDREDSTIPELVETQQNSCEKNGSDHTNDERFTNKHLLAEHELPADPDPSVSPAEQKMTFNNKSLRVQVSTPHAAFFTDSGQLLDTSCSTTSAHCTTLQERMDLEMSVLRRQEAVLILQEEYYALKIKMMKKQMEELVQKD